MTKYFNRQCQEIGIEEWAQLFQDRGYWEIATFADDRITIATCWLGFERGMDAPRRIFDTTIFGFSFIRSDRRRWRWSSEAQARAGHDVVVAAYRENIDPDAAVARFFQER
jgi:hypothetical protein